MAELHSDLPCLCLDIDKRALHTGVISAHNKWGNRPRKIFALFSFSKGLHDLLAKIKSKVSVPIVVLLQHPSPSREKKSRENLSLAGCSCTTALEESLISSVHFVYDHDPNKETKWTKSTLAETFLKNASAEVRKLLVKTKEKLISEKDRKEVNHPIFGRTERCGWAEWRKSNEYCFSIHFLQS